MAEQGQGIRELEVTVTYDNEEAWRHWATVSTSATTTINVTWNNWTTSSTTLYGTGSTGYVAIACTPPEYEPPSEEELEQARLRSAQRRAEALERDRIAEERTVAADVRATELLFSLINAEQREQWEAHKYFDVTVRSGRTYRIHRGVAGNVRLLEDGEETEALCCHPSRAIFDDAGTYRGEMPIVDVVVGQLMALRFDEDDFRQTANISNYRGRRQAHRRVAHLAA